MLSGQQAQQNKRIVDELEIHLKGTSILPTGTMLVENGQHIRIGWIDSDMAMNDLIRFCQKHRLGFQYRNNLFFIEFPKITDEL